MSAAEQRYRAALRWYPVQWRQQHGDYVLGTLLDADEHDPDRRPGRIRMELVTLALHGLAARANFLTNPTSRALAAAICLAAGAAYALFQFVTFDIYAVGAYVTAGFGEAAPLRMVPDLSWLLPALWLTAVVATLAGWRRLRVASLLGVPLVVLLILVPRLLAYSAGGVSRYALLFETVSALVAASGTPARRPALGALAGWAVLLSLVAWNADALRGTASIWIWALGPFNAAGLTLGLVAVALLIGACINVQQIRTAGALLLSATPWAVMLLAELATDRFNHFTPAFAVNSLGFLALCGTVLVVLYRRYRRRSNGSVGGVTVRDS